MRRSVLVVLLIALVGVPLVSCQKLSDVRRGQLPPQPSPFQGAIPAEYGDVVGVISRPDQSMWVQVWLVKPDKSIVVMFVNLDEGTMGDRIVTIPRR